MIDLMMKIGEIGMFALLCLILIPCLYVGNFIGEKLADYLERTYPNVEE